MFIISLTLTINNTANATSINVTGRLQNSSGISIAGAYVYATLPSSNSVIYGPSITNSLGNYALSIGTQGVYDLHFIPPSDSGYTKIINNQIEINTGMNVNGTFPNTMSTLSGVLTDNSGSQLPGVTVKIIKGSSVYQSTTDISGNYSITAPSDKYYLSLTGSIVGITSFNLNQSYSSSINLLNGNSILNLTLQTANLLVTAKNNSGQSAWGSNENVTARATKGTTYLYPGDPGTTISLVYSSQFSTTASPTGTIKTIVGASYTSSGLESTSNSTSICKNISGKTGVYDCLVLPHTVSGDDSFDIPQQSPNVRIFSGTLTDSSNDPIPNAKITLIKYGDTSTTTQTNSNGEFSISVSPKKYSLQIYKPGVHEYISNFTLTQSPVNPTLDLTSSDLVKDLKVDNTILTVTAYDKLGNLNYFTTVNARATNGVAYLYTGDPGHSLIVNSVPFTTNLGATGTIGTIVGSQYTALGEDSAQWVGSICESIPGSKFDCITNALTVTGPSNISIPHP